MSLTCLNCNSVNPDGASLCRKCGYATLVGARTKSSKSSSSLSKLNKPIAPGLSGIFLACVLFLLCFFVVKEALEVRSRHARCTETVSGLLDEKYKVITRSKLFIPIGKSYEVKYLFLVNDQEYKGHDSLPNEPTSRDVSVKYNPSNPSENFVEPTSGLTLISIFLAVVLFGGGGVVILMVTVKKRPQES